MTGSLPKVRNAAPPGRCLPSFWLSHRRTRLRTKGAPWGSGGPRVKCTGGNASADHLPGRRRHAGAATLRSMDNAQIADRLEAFAALLELSEANPYTRRAYRRAAETIRGASVPVADLVSAGRVRELRGIGPGIEARLRELVETGAIAELAELERELAPDLIGLGRYLGLGAKRSVEIAHAVGATNADELRDAIVSGRLREVRGVGPKTEARLLERLQRDDQTRPERGLLLPRARDLVAGVAAALDGTPAGDARRWRDVCERLAVVC